MPSLVATLRRTARSAPGRLSASLGKIAQAAVAAGLAWYLATLLLGQPQTVFAPFAAIVVLLGGTGGRGRRGVEVAVGVGVGVLVGEGLVGLLNKGPLSIALGAGLAMLVVAPFYTDNLPIIQAGIAAGIVITADSPASGTGRLLAALLGVAVALLCSQVLFTPSPARVLEHGIDDALTAHAAAADALATALREGREVPEGVRDDLVAAGCALADTRARADSMRRRTVRGRHQAARIRARDDRAGRVAELVDELLALRHDVAGSVVPDAADRLDGLRATARTLARPGTTVGG